MDPTAAPVDIFATKGIEYLIILFFLAAFLTFWLMFTDRHPNVKVKGRKSKNLMDWFSVPEGLFFHQGHAWAKVESAGVLKVGMDDFAQKMVGTAKSVLAGKPGEKVRQGEEGWTLKMGNRSIPMLAPVNGEILEVNKEALANPTLINRDPYGKGWLIKIKAENFVRDSKNLLSGKLARRWIEDVTDKLRASMGTTELGPVYQDGGVVLKEMARKIDKQNWEKLLGEFFLTR
jgi:glycine cleavage system H lipoate-binding protein